MRLFLQNHIVQGAIGGAVAAAAVDFQAFKKWQNFHDAATYGWGVAAFRWFQGAIAGAVTAAGLTALG